MTRAQQEPGRTTTGVVMAGGVVIGVIVAFATSDVILGVIAGASFIAIVVGLLRVWYGGGSPRPRHQ